VWVWATDSDKDFCGPSHLFYVVLGQLDISAVASEGVDDGTEEQLRHLYRESAPFLYTTLRRITWPGADVEDMLQDVFVVALKRRAALLSASSPRAWLYGVALKVASDRRRRHALWSFLGLESTAELEVERGPHEQLERAQSEALLQRALAALSAPKRDVFVLYELDGLSGQETSEAVGAPLNTVWSRLLHARRELAELCRELSEPAEW
jgi:RNA polymerase sigma-70 factor, ECF subfamily